MGTEQPRMTVQTLAIVNAFLDEPQQERYGLEVAERAQLRSGTIYPALARLERAGWLSSHWEDLDPAEAGRPRRRLYHLTATGEVAARDALEASLQQIRRARRRPALGLRPRGQPG